MHPTIQVQSMEISQVQNLEIRLQRMLQFGQSSPINQSTIAHLFIEMDVKNIEVFMWGVVDQIQILTQQFASNFMSQKGKNGKPKRAQISSDTLVLPEQSSLVPKTPVRKSTSAQESFSSTLSPLPFPPKVEFSHYNGPQLLSGGMKIVETPVRQQVKIFPLEGEMNEGIHIRIIFESEEEDQQNNSSSVGSSISEEEEDEPNSEEGQQEEKQDEASGSQGSPSEQNERHAYQGAENRQIIRKMLHSRATGVKIQQTSGKKIFCNCKKTKCLKLYCDCFRLNQTCEGCNCQGCHNLDVYNEERNNAILALMDRNPDPFSQKIEDDKHLKGCNCKKSNCLKKYCECYQAGLKCGQNCKCEECKNVVRERNGEGQRGVGSRLTAKKERKMVQIL